MTKKPVTPQQVWDAGDDLAHQLDSLLAHYRTGSMRSPGGVIDRIGRARKKWADIKKRIDDEALKQMTSE